VYAKFCCAALHIKKAFGIFRELIPRTRKRTTTTTTVALWDPPSGSKNNFQTKIKQQNLNQHFKTAQDCQPVEAVPLIIQVLHTEILYDPPCE